MIRVLPQPFAAWLAARDARERLLLVVGAVVLVAALVYLAIWQPLLTRRDAELARITRYDRLITAVAELPTKARATPDPRPIATILAQTAAAQGLTILRLDTPKAQTATVTLQDTPFETLVLWIDGLNRDTGLAITSATIRRTETAGTVSADLSLERAAP